MFCQFPVATDFVPLHWLLSVMFALLTCYL
jgi:hypothetical protein